MSAMRPHVADKKRKSSAGGGRLSSDLESSFMLDDLPDAILVEILCRLPCNKLIFQYKCVSKRWVSLISAPYFIRLYLHLQRDLQKPILTTLVTFNHYFKSQDEYLFISSDEPVFKSIASNFSLSFLPCYQDPKVLRNLGHEHPWRRLKKRGHLKAVGLVPPVVVGTYKDLVLCSPTRDLGDYYICNPYTKQWTALPPGPSRFNTVYAATLVVYDPYYKYSDDDHIIQLNAEYRWKVVQIVPENSTRTDCNYHVDIFSSETREWRELVVLSSSKPFYLFANNQHSASMANNGMLYWWRYDGFMFELDLDQSMSMSSNIAKCRFIELPEGANIQGLFFPVVSLFVSRGRLRLCIYDDDRQFSHLPLRVWELNQVVKDDQTGKFKWLADSFALTSEHIPLDRQPCCLYGFHQNDEDIVYLEHDRQLFTCNVRGAKLETTATRNNFHGPPTQVYYRFVLPWWPTPVPKL
ncbi:hypothetical protein M0R45_032283 [Rubus argutus]|uniref:F-box domain-containing protein n=1 Tax=Rubus argutus TaxID=59490 RepID=A0AAW1WG27_RUBAR